ncbi:MAG: copper chaperone PCu(A)C [Parvibaculaceae bacterium]
MLMRRLIIELAFATGLTIAAVVAVVAAAHAGDVMVSGAFARASATPAAKTGAVYFTIRNEAATPDKLTGVATDAAQSAMLHENVEENGVVSMRHLDALPIAAKETVTLAPAKTHVMLMGLKAPLEKGGHISLTLTFEKAGTVKVDVPIGAVAATAAE